MTRRAVPEELTETFGGGAGAGLRTREAGSVVSQAFGINKINRNQEYSVLFILLFSSVVKETVPCSELQVQF
jgi:hypothetical protein